MYRPMTQQEQDDWDEREEMLVRGLVSNRQESHLAASITDTRSSEDDSVRTVVDPLG